MSGEIKYTIYEMFEMMIERIGWPSEQIKLDLLDTVREASKTNAVGIIGKIMACNHLDIETRTEGRYQTAATYCKTCERKMT